MARSPETSPIRTVSPKSVISSSRRRGVVWFSIILLLFCCVVLLYLLFKQWSHLKSKKFDSTFHPGEWYNSPNHRLFLSFLYTMPEEDVPACKQLQRNRYRSYVEYSHAGIIPRFWSSIDISHFKPCGLDPSHHPLVLDVGGDGQWTQPFGKKCPGTRLVIWEPNPFTASNIKNSKLASLSSTFLDVVVLESAASNFTGTDKFYFNAPEGESPNGALLGKPDSPSVNVDITTVDGVLQEMHVDYIPFFKISARGNEHQVLRGAERALSFTHTIWFGCSQHSKTPLRETIDFLDTHGFLTFKVSHSGLAKMYGNYWDDMHVTHAGDHTCMAIRKASPLLGSLKMVCDNLRSNSGDRSSRS